MRIRASPGKSFFPAHPPESKIPSPKGVSRWAGIDPKRTGRLEWPHCIISLPEKKGPIPPEETIPFFSNLLWAESTGEIGDILPLFLSRREKKGQKDATGSFPGRQTNFQYPREGT